MKLEMSFYGYLTISFSTQFMGREIYKIQSFLFTLYIILFLYCILWYVPEILCLLIIILHYNLLPAQILSPVSLLCPVLSAVGQLHPNSLVPCAPVEVMFYSILLLINIFLLLPWPGNSFLLVEPYTQE